MYCFRVSSLSVWALTWTLGVLGSLLLSSLVDFPPLNTTTVDRQRVECSLTLLGVVVVLSDSEAAPEVGLFAASF